MRRYAARPGCNPTDRRELIAVRIAVCCAWVLAASIGFPSRHATAQQRTQVARAQPQIAVLLADTPLRLLPDASLGSLLMIQAGVTVRVNRIDGLWAEVVVEKSQFGPRTGYVEVRYIRLGPQGATASTSSNQPTGNEPGVVAKPAQLVTPPNTSGNIPSPTTQVAPVDQNVTPSATAAHPAALPLIRERVPDSGARPPRPPRASEPFLNSKINVTVEDKTRESDVIIRYDLSALVILDKKSGEAMKTFRYAEMEGAEYSYAKNPRWKTAIFVSPLFLFTSGKKHWFLVQGPGDYALLHLDKSNYRLIVAAFEARTGLKVEAVTDTK